VLCARLTGQPEKGFKARDGMQLYAALGLALMYTKGAK
jgi:hypothetical protein